MFIRPKQIAQEAAAFEEVLSWNGALWVPDALFGSNLSEGESLGLSTTTSTTYQQKLRVSTPSNTPAGTYHIEWCGAWSCSIGTYVCNMRVQIDDTDTVWEVDPVSMADGTAGRHPAFGQCEVDLSAGSHDIDFDYSSESGSNTAAVAEVRIKIWRIS